MGLNWLSVLLGLFAGAFLFPWAKVKFMGTTSSSTGGY